GDADIIVAGGMESMSKAALLLTRARWGYRLGHGQLMDQLILFDPLSQCTMGQTAENVARTYHIDRESQDQLALLSQQRAEKAITEGRFKEQIIPLEVKQKKGAAVFDTDEHPRFGTTMAMLQKLRPVFVKDGTVTAGNSSGMNDAGAACVVMRESKARELGREPLAYIKAYAYVGVDPAHMGIGPVPATRAALEKAGMTVDDLDLIELNEAFASQAVYCVRELGLEDHRDKVNVFGGAIALGHPISGSGACLITKLLYALKDLDKTVGLVTMCIGGGQGISLIVERR
ncbi:MAG: acetyl-CoA C-acyltransferase, partial [Proteobacteria bacterium]|nr:acetyl-CoA C-acyltransferase [Pseudomonadota bacterium]